MSNRKKDGQVKLTRQGVAAGLLTLFILIIAWNTGIYVYYAAASSLISMFLVSYGFTRVTLRKMEANVVLPHGVHRGTPFPVTIRLNNPRSRLPVLYLRIKVNGMADEENAVVPVIPPKGEVSARFNLRLDRRGVYPVPLIEVSSAAPFGFLTISRGVQAPGEIVVYPRVRPLKTAAFNEIQRFGNVPRKTIGDGGDFFSLREYLPGDDLRLVAWRVSARTNTLMVRELSAESSRETVIVLDTRRVNVPQFEDEFENAVELAASLACTLLNRQFSVGFFSNGLFIPLDHGSMHLTKLLDALARVQPDMEGASDPFHAAVQRDWVPGIRFLFISPDPEKWARPVGAGFHVLDPREVIYA